MKVYLIDDDLIPHEIGELSSLDNYYPEMINFANTWFGKTWYWRKHTAYDLFCYVCNQDNKVLTIQPQKG